MAAFSTKLPSNAFPRFPSHLRDRPADWGSFADMDIINDDGRFESSDEDGDDSDSSDEDIGCGRRQGSIVAAIEASPSGEPSWFEQTAEGFTKKGDTSTSGGAVVKGEEAMMLFMQEIKVKAEALGLASVPLDLVMDPGGGDDDEEDDPYADCTLEEIRARLVVCYLPREALDETEKWGGELDRVGLADEDEDGKKPTPREP